MDRLIEALSDSDESIREKAAEILGEIGNEKDIYQIESYLQDSKGYNDAYEAIQEIKFRESQEVKLKLIKKRRRRNNRRRRVDYDNR